MPSHIPSRPSPSPSPNPSPKCSNSLGPHWIKNTASPFFHGVTILDVVQASARLYAVCHGIRFDTVMPGGVGGVA
eukprot:7291805-Pyramimonas_sp.AAC.1